MGFVQASRQRRRLTLSSGILAALLPCILQDSFLEASQTCLRFVTEAPFQITPWKPQDLFVETHSEVLHIPLSDVILVGRSLGAAVALQVAASLGWCLVSCKCRVVRSEPLCMWKLDSVDGSGRFGCRLWPCPDRPFPEPPGCCGTASWQSKVGRECQAWPKN